MSTIRELVFDWLFNASVQIGLFAILAAILSPFMAKAKATHKHYLYLAVFALCLGAPVFNTLWHTHSSVVVKGSQQQPILGTEHPEQPFWAWNVHSKGYESIILAPGAKTALLVIWQVLRRSGHGWCISSRDHFPQQSDPSSWGVGSRGDRCT